MFFTCHPADWQTHFLPVCEELFQFCDCAIYYCDPNDPSPRDSTYYAELRRRMHLLVVPVTSAFLTEPNPALDQDFHYAESRCIPILPLVREPGLDKLFAQFRDIGLWYDEHLTPGEDFNDEIEVHLNDSKLFALIVTPNLVNEKNYVQEHEYPQAVERSKPVVPIQYEATDSDTLRREYPNIPDCLDPEDAAAVEYALNSALSGIARCRNDHDPDHWYHIGLAYLTGTDVEVDHSLAVKLITAAAEAGLEEAMDKLATMYRDGYGVRRDPAQVIHWTQKLVELAQRRYENQVSDVNSLLYCARLGIAASVCVSIDRYDLAANYTKRKIALEKPLFEAAKRITPNCWPPTKCWPTSTAYRAMKTKPPTSFMPPISCSTASAKSPAVSLPTRSLL